MLSVVSFRCIFTNEGKRSNIEMNERVQREFRRAFKQIPSIDPVIILLLPILLLSEGPKNWIIE